MAARKDLMPRIGYPLARWWMVFRSDLLPEIDAAQGTGISADSKAKEFGEVGKKIDLFMRFPTVAGERGAAGIAKALATK